MQALLGLTVLFCISTVYADYTIGWGNPNATFAAIGTDVSGGIQANVDAGMKIVVSSSFGNLPTGTQLSYTVLHQDGTSQSVNMGNITGVGQEFEVQNFSKGDLVSFNVSGTDSSWISGMGWQSPSANYVFQYGGYPVWNVTLNLSGTSQVVPKPSGQPLPGVILTFAIAAVMSVVWYNRRNKKTATVS